MDLPKSEEFILDVRRAAGEVEKPTVLTSGAQLMSGETYARILQQADLWLTPKVVERYDPTEFQEWPKEVQDRLSRAVDSFRRWSSTVPPNKPANREQYEKGLEALKQILGAIREQVLREWLTALGQLTSQVTTWCDECEWPWRRYPKELEETLLGKYKAEQIQLYAEQNHYVLDPLARFVPGAKGALDLMLVPSFYVTSVYRDFNGVWHVHLDAEKGAAGNRRTPWSKDSFIQALRNLRALL